MITQVIVMVNAVKLLFMPLYHSTDFEVHRNWLAITHNKSIDEWYFESTSEWTLDYPPFFAWLEYGLSHIAKFFDPEMLIIENLNYASEVTVMFQRLSVIFLDLIYIYGVKKCSDLLSNGKLLVFILLVSNPGLLMVDHIHFQCNGFLYGILLLSIAHMIKSNFIQSALWFAILLNFKHIYMYVAPVYVVYLLRAYCLTVSSIDGVHTPWYSFSFTNLTKLGATVITVFALSFGPFIHQLPQLFSRLFPFKRGLSHAYWAPNFWALYNFVDKVLFAMLKLVGIKSPSNVASMTGGLVQEYEHSVLPSISPSVSFVFTFLSMLPALIKLWHLGADRRYRNMSFVRCIAICATCAFIFGWHVHEKAILMVLIPLSFLSVLGEDDAKSYLLLSIVGHYSIFPLLYPKNLSSIKLFMLLTHCAMGFANIPRLYDDPKSKKPKCRCTVLPMLVWYESLYALGFVPLFLYDTTLHWYYGWDKRLPFLPLMITSVYCALGVLYCWLTYYYYFLTFNLSRVPTLLTRRTLQFYSKNK